MIGFALEVPHPNSLKVQKGCRGFLGPELSSRRNAVG